MRAGKMTPANATRDEPSACNGIGSDAPRNDDLVTEGIGSLAHDNGYGLGGCQNFMRPAVMPNLDWLIVRHTEVDSHNSSASPLA
jgi:hypothetical protein